MPKHSTDVRLSTPIVANPPETQIQAPGALLPPKEERMTEIKEVFVVSRKDLEEAPDMMSYLVEGRDKVLGIAALFLILFWRFGYTVSIESGYENEFMSNDIKIVYYITIVNRDNNG